VFIVSVVFVVVVVFFPIHLGGIYSSKRRQSSK